MNESGVAELWGRRVGECNSDRNMSANKNLLARRAAVVTHGLPRVTMATVVSGKGAILIDAEGNELIDFAGGIGVMNVGHGREAVVRAIQEQASKLVHTCIHVTTYEPYVALCEKLVKLLPHGERTKCLLVNSGAEAVENAIKIARQATGRQAIICFGDAFHGRTLMCMSVSSKTGYKTGCGPFAPEIYRVPFPNHYHHGDGLEIKAFVTRELERLREALHGVVAAEQVAGVLIEAVQGEGGFVPAPMGYLSGLREICDEHGILLILDEVQSGFCRTGKWAAYEHHGVRPDISVFAKSMGAGMPIAAVLGRAEVMDAAQAGTLGGTYGGNPVSCAAALAAIRIMEDENLNARAVEVGKQVFERFESLQRRCRAVGDVRGLGAMVGMELVEDGDRHRPAPEMVKRVVEGCVARGLLVVSAGTHGNVLRILGPLVITDAQLERGLTILEEEVLKAAETVATPHPRGAATSSRQRR